MKWLNFGYQVCKRTLKKLYFRPIHLVFSFAQPLFWLTIFGYLFERQFAFDSDISYLSYLLPVVCAMTVLQSSAQSGILFIKDFQSQFFGRYHFTPISSFSLLFFKIVADFIRIWIQVVILMLIGHLMGISSISISFTGILIASLATFLFTFFYASLSCFIALKTKTPELMATFVQLFNLPIIFTSTVLVPNKNLPPWLAKIAQYNPLSILGSTLRQELTFYNEMGYSTPLSLGIIFSLALISFTISLQYIRKINYL